MSKAGDGGFSSFWFPAYIDLMLQAMLWIKMNCDVDPSGYGWKFKN